MPHKLILTLDLIVSKFNDPLTIRFFYSIQEGNEKSNSMAGHLQHVVILGEIFLLFLLLFFSFVYKAAGMEETNVKSLYILSVVRNFTYRVK